MENESQTANTEAVVNPAEMRSVDKRMLESWIKRLLSVEIKMIYAANLLSVAQEMETILTGQKK